MTASALRPVTAGAIADAIRAAGLLRAFDGAREAAVAALAHDSRAVEPDTAFVAIRGAKVDGHDFLDAAAQAGATVAIVEQLPGERLPVEARHDLGREGLLGPGLRAVIRVTDARAALAEAASVLYGRPSDRMRLVGVTGTNGKTTVSSLLYHAFDALGETAGLLGTIAVRFGPEARPSTHTTPDALALHALLAEMADEGCTAAAMEVSSHALDQERVRAQRFAAGVFTNLTHDHLDYHRTIEAYRDAKARLFTMLPADAVAVVNRDDEAADSLVKGTSARVVTFGQGPGGRRPSGNAGDAPQDIPFEVITDGLDGLHLRLDGREARFRLAGGFNAYNLAAAYATLVGMGYGADEALAALAEAPPVPGRLEPVRPADIEIDAPGPIGIIDYAHTPDALANVLATTRAMLPEGGRLHVVFGCGGDRDRAKRPVMGRHAAELADRVVLTNDNPRTEDPHAILDEIAAGMDTPPALVEPDRAAAIRAAFAEAGPNDAVVVSGKGHETTQEVGTTMHPFDDRAHVRDALRDALS